MMVIAHYGTHHLQLTQVDIITQGSNSGDQSGVNPLKNFFYVCERHWQEYNCWAYMAFVDDASQFITRDNLEDLHRL